MERPQQRPQQDESHPCGPHGTAKTPATPVSEVALERAAALFRAVGDVARLRLLHQLDVGEQCVTELAEATGTKLSTLSQQLRVLYAERIVKRRREGKHIFYSLTDDHVRSLIHAAIEHASEPPLIALSAPDLPSYDLNAHATRTRRKST